MSTTTNCDWDQLFQFFVIGILRHRAMRRQVLGKLLHRNVRGIGASQKRLTPANSRSFNAMRRGRNLTTGNDDGGRKDR